MRSSRRRGLRILSGAAAAGAAGFGSLLAWGALSAARRLSVREEDVALPGPDTLDVRVALLSDLHLGRLANIHREAARAVNAFRPHVIALTGDFLQRRRGLLTLEAFLDLLEPGPVLLAVPGNWDHAAGVVPSALERTLASRGGGLLVNAWCRVRSGGGSVLVSGLDDPVKGRPDLVEALESAEPADLHILLVHAPAWRDGLEASMEALARRRGPDAARALRPDLILAGHTHGGQVRIGSLAWTPKGSGDYLRGWYRDGPVAMFVSPGVGTVVPVRVGAPPEVALFRITGFPAA